MVASMPGARWKTFLAVAFLLAPLACRKPQTPADAMAGWVTAYDTGDITAASRFFVTRDPGAEWCQREMFALRLHPPKPKPLPAGFAEPQPGLVAALSKGIVGGKPPVVVSEKRDGDRIVQTYANGRSTTFRLVSGDWKVDLDAVDDSGKSMGSRCKEALEVMKRIAEPAPVDGGGR
jgi:hypothetical protein